VVRCMFLLWILWVQFSCLVTGRGLQEQVGNLSSEGIRMLIESQICRVPA
jgi:hypothetical protein